MSNEKDKIDWKKLGLMTDEELDEIDKNLRKTEEEGVKNILKYFDRIHDKLFTFNNILIAGYFALVKLVDSISPLTIIVPVLNLGFLVYLEYRMMEKSRFEANLRSKNKSQIDKHGLSINKTNLYSLLAIGSTAGVTMYFLYNLFFINPTPGDDAKTLNTNSRGSSDSLQTQILLDTDSMAICQNTRDFFDWYINAKKNGEDFQPIFIESGNGMTTLGFEEYFANLKKHHFSDSLILQERQSYSKCIQNLEKIKYKDFKSKVLDLEAFEKIDCDFGNYYHWLGGQEPPDKINITKITFHTNKSASIRLTRSVHNTEEKKDIDIGQIVVELRKIGNAWKITSINWS